jgi:hypothetical protein
MRDRRWLVGSAIMIAMLAGIAAGTAAEVLGPGRVAPDLAAGAWINSEALTMPGLRGRVVLVEFWTYG